MLFFRYLIVIATANEIRQLSTARNFNQSKKICSLSCRVCVSEMEIARFLFSCYCNNEMAKQTIDNYATMRTHFPEIFVNRSPEYIRDNVDST